jgi:hypothetical protein
MLANFFSPKVFNISVIGLFKKILKFTFEAVESFHVLLILVGFIK